MPIQIGTPVVVCANYPNKTLHHREGIVIHITYGSAYPFVVQIGTIQKRFALGEIRAIQS